MNIPSPTTNPRVVASDSTIDPSSRALRRPFLIAAAVYAAVTATILIASFRAAGGHFIYALDDTYINMAMAKNVALHGVWGVTRYEFGSASSAPLFTLLLSGMYRLTGPNQYVPLALSWIFGLASIWGAARIAAEYLTEAWQTVTLIAMVLLTPLFVIGLLGMEHSLHLFLTLLFLRHFDKISESGWAIAAITAAMAGVRYEGVFVAMIAYLILILQRKWSRAAIIFTAAWLPVGCYAVFSIAHGGYWLPNSVALKGIHDFGLSIRAKLAKQLLFTLVNSLRGIHLVFLLSGTAIIAIALRRTKSHLANMAALLAGAGCVHLVVAGIGWVFRYEDYLVGAMIVVVACALPVLMENRKAVAVAVACVSLCATAALMARSLIAGTSLPRYSRAIYLQQWQMASFLHNYYPNAAVAANDIGAINFRNNLHCLDMVGLASTEVFSAKRANAYTTQFLDRLATQNRVRIAIIYDSWFPSHPDKLSEGPPIPSSWTRVGRWRVDHQEQLGGDTVSFYALAQDEVQPLRENLAKFSTALPKGTTALPDNSP